MAIEDVRAREQKWQEVWKKEKVFEGVPSDKEKFFCTFPYPYVNGLPHVGHLFTIMRVEAFARYHRLLGKNVLFPQGWHATGSPIATAAMRVKEGEQKQIDILKDIGVPKSEISKFTEPENWIAYFVPKYKADLQSVGLSIDWRREFHTTSLNPQYDSFIRWQFATLKEKGLVEQGEHPVVWCPKENTPVGDHARQSGEGETPQEFVLVKHKLDDGRILVSATLRVDTIFGVTNLYVHPEIEYAEAKIGDETWILSEDSITHLQEQGLKIEKTGDVLGQDLIGQETTEFAGHKVLVLPATFLDPKYGTGLVHSVPSDSADDLIALQDLQKNVEELEKYGLDIAKVQAIKSIEVLNTKGIGGNPAQHFLDKYDVKHQNERKKLDQIRKELYKLGFYHATYNDLYKKGFSEDLSGKTVADGKELIAKELIEEGWAHPYYQLTGRVVCRCQTEAIVKIVSDQWFLAYENKEWKEQVHGALADMKLYPEKARSQFNYVIDWLNAWACSREYGLGTRLPWDEQWLIESLSDSTIYMAYYTIAHLVKDVPAENLTKEFYDWVFFEKGEKPDVENVEEMRKEFMYWYPLDFRNSGKDLIQNHLTFMLFNHCAIFPKEQWPKSIGVNGWVTVNGQKMSKSLGNVIPVRQLVTEYGADATRITILNGGEGLDDPNWDSDFARGMHNKLDNLRQAEECKDLKGGPSSVDAWFESRMNELIKLITEAMELTNFSTAIQLAFFEFNQMLKWYLVRTKPNAKLFRTAIENQLIMCAPFIPHVCEEAWKILENDGLVSEAKWPAFDEKKTDNKLSIGEELVKGVAERVKKAEGKDVILYLAADWKRDAFAAFDKIVEKTRNPSEIMKELLQGKLKEHGEELSRLINFLVKSRTPGYVPTAAEENKWLESASDYLQKVSGGMISVQEAGSEGKSASGMPGRPAVEVQ